MISNFIKITIEVDLEIIEVMLVQIFPKVMMFKDLNIILEEAISVLNLEMHRPYLINNNNIEIFLNVFFVYIFVSVLMNIK